MGGTGDLHIRGLVYAILSFGLLRTIASFFPFPNGTKENGHIFGLPCPVNLYCYNFFDFILRLTENRRLILSFP